MDEPRRLLQTVATDRRVWGLTGLLAGWPALGMVTRQGVVLETATPMVWVYLVALNGVVPGFPSDALFWVGLVGFYFVVAAVLVGLFDWVRTRTVGAERSDGRTPE